MKPNYFQYSTKIWLTSVIVSPFLWISWTYLFETTGDLKSFFGFIGLAVIYGAILSLVNWMLLIIGTKLILSNGLSKITKRILISILVLFLVSGLFTLIFAGDDPITWSETLFKIPLFYISTLLFGVWYFDFNS